MSFHIVERSRTRQTNKRYKVMGLLTGRTLSWVVGVLLAASPLAAGAERPGLSAALLKRVRAAGVKTVRAPVLSPAGDVMVFVGEFAEMWQFVSIRTGTPRTDIWLINRDLTGLRRLTRDGYSDDSSWSPSGGEIAFVDYGSVKVMDLQTGKVRGLRGLKSSKPYTMECDYEMYERPEWSPNGRGILARSGNGCGGPFVVVNSRSGRRLWEKLNVDEVHWDKKSRLLLGRSGRTGGRRESIVVNWDRVRGPGRARRYS